MVAYMQPFFNELCFSFITFPIFVHWQRLIAQNVHELLFFNSSISHFYAACCTNDVRRGSILGSEIDATLALVYRKVASQKFCIVSVCVFTAKIDDLSGHQGNVTWCGHLPDSGIQWLQLKPWMCAIWQCAIHHTDASAWPSKLPVICLHFLLSSISLLATTVANDHVMVQIN